MRALDNLSPQVHGEAGERPAYLDPQVELFKGDVRNPEAVQRSIEGVDAVLHLAAMVGVGQSMYQIDQYTSVNNLGTAVLLQALIDQPVQKLIVASSMSLYGEGLCRKQNGEFRPGAERPLEQLKARDWELRDEDGQELEPVPTPETKQPSLASIYALSKYDQERLCLITGRAYGIPTTAMRFFNVYGTRQALSNPYTGVMAIFASRLMNGNAPMIFEDGLQQRDFVSVKDVARACRLALESNGANDGVFNVGSGNHYTIVELARKMGEIMGVEDIEPEITGKYRVGDVRHCFADISKARKGLGYEPQVRLEDGLAELVEWLAGQSAIDMVDKARAELSARGLTV